MCCITRHILSYKAQRVWKWTKKSNASRPWYSAALKLMEFGFWHILTQNWYSGTHYLFDIWCLLVSVAWWSTLLSSFRSWYSSSFPEAINDKDLGTAAAWKLSSLIKLKGHIKIRQIKQDNDSNQRKRKTFHNDERVTSENYNNYKCVITSSQNLKMHDAGRLSGRWAKTQANPVRTHTHCFSSFLIAGMNYLTTTS